jgi:hypothetical protein
MYILPKRVCGPIWVHNTIRKYCRSRGFRLSSIFLIKSSIACWKSSFYCESTSKPLLEVRGSARWVPRARWYNKSLLERFGTPKMSLPSSSSDGYPLGWTGRGFSWGKFHPESTAINADLCFSVKMGSFWKLLAIFVKQNDGSCRPCLKKVGSCWGWMLLEVEL